MEDYQVTPEESDLPRYEEENQQKRDRYRTYCRSQPPRSHREFVLAIFPTHYPSYGRSDGCSEVGEEGKEPKGYDDQAGREQHENWGQEGEEWLAGESEVCGGREG